MGEVTAQEALALGINWILAPIADVNNNPDNPVINIRAFGDRPEIVSALVTAFIKGAKQYSVLTTAKHFPGHGDTATDSHLHLPVLSHSPERLAAVELPPFQAAIAAGVDTVMTAHLQIPAWDRENPATLSAAILTGQLRENLGFEGLIVTDALIMGGVTQIASPGEVAVRALEAGADILLMPPDPVETIEAVWAAVESGRLTEARIEQSVHRIQQAKNHLAIASVTPHPLKVAQPASRQTVQEIIKSGLQTGGILPLALETAIAKRNLIIVDDLLNCDFLDRACPSVTIPQVFGYQRQLLDQSSLGQVSLAALPTLLQVFVRGNPFRGTAGLTPEAEHFYQTIFQANWLQGLILYGSPYVLEWFRSQLSPDFPWVFSYGQMPQSQAIACQQLLGSSEQTTELEGKDFV
jgi:beta-glucosidase